MGQKNILLIENQYTQFENIKDLITVCCMDEFIVYPDIKEFTTVADWVRISLNRRYDKSRRDDALKRLEKYIVSEKEIDLLIVDHILIGHTDGGNGIHLIKDLQSCNIQLPYIFLSRTPRNNRDVAKDLRKELQVTEPHQVNWIDKGYANIGIGTEDYFNRNVIPIIKNVINMKEKKDQLAVDRHLNETINGIIRINSFDIIHSKEFATKVQQLCDEDKTKFIAFFYNRTSTITKDDGVEFLKSLKLIQ